MKKGIHPKLYEITVTDSEDKVLKVLSAKKGDLKINNSKLNHPAWSKKTSKTKGNPRAEKIADVFGDILG